MTDDAFADPPTLTSVPPSSAALALDVRTVADQLAAVVPAMTRMLAELDTYPVASASPDERAALVELYWQLKALHGPLTHRIRGLELAWARGFSELGATKLPLPDGRIVAFEPARAEWQVQADALKRELAELRKDGLITDADLERAFKTVVTVTADNRVLNALADSRGDIVADVIAQRRQREEPSPLAGRVRFPKP